MRSHAAEVAEEAANKSGQYQRHGAVVVQNGKVVSSGFNKTSGRYPSMQTLHAEMAAIKMCGSAVDSHVYVVRVNNNGDLANSMPCRRCYMYMVKHGISRVWWSTGNGGEFKSISLTRNREYPPQPETSGHHRGSALESAP
jgi:deoxycytidylate deaminase